MRKHFRLHHGGGISKPGRMPNEEPQGESRTYGLACEVNPAQCNSLRRKNFTIIELLVVIAVISLLMTLLLPALNSARSYAHDAVCMNNMRQLGIVGLNYTIDNNDCWPLFYDAKTGRIWYNYSVPGFVGVYAGRDVLYTNYTCPPSLLCPAIVPRTIENGLVPATSYGMNGQGFADAGANVWNSANAYNLRRIKSCSAKIVHIDSGAKDSLGKTEGRWDVWRDGANIASSDCKVGYRHKHNTSACALFFDGHASMPKHNELYVAPALQPRDCWDVYDMK